MNILIASENFSGGGLETHIYTLYNKLKEDNNIFFAFGKYNNKLDISEAKIFSGFNFSPSSTLKEFVDDVNQLVSIIKNNNIDVLHVHPYYSLFPAIIAANITDTKLVYTYHGRGSFNFCNNINEFILFNFGLETTINHIFSVSELGVQAFKNHGFQNVSLFPNLINTNIFKKHSIVYNKTWALLSRLDNDKITEIKKIIDIFPQLDINELHIYGSGTEKQNLLEYIETKKLSNRIICKGYIDHPEEELYGKYTGIMGVGRVALESLCMNYPVLLIGYGKVAGLIDKTLYNRIKNMNFVPDLLEEIELDLLIKQISDINKGKVDRYQLRKNVVNDFSTDKVDAYIETISNIHFCGTQIMLNIFKTFQELIKKGFETDSFYTSKNVYDVFVKYIGTYTQKMDIKNAIIERNTYYNTINKIKEEYSEKIQLLEEKIHVLEVEKMNTADTFRGSLIKIKQKFLKKSPKKKKIFLLMQLYNEEKNLPTFLQHIEPFIDGIIAFDDASIDRTNKLIRNSKKLIELMENTGEKSKWAERENREKLIRKAYECGADWVICADPDERFEIKFLKQLRKIVNQTEGMICYGVHFRELWNRYNQYRSDGIWNQKEKYILFPLQERMTFDYRYEYHQPWYYKELSNSLKLLNNNLYHLKMICYNDRVLRKDLYNKLDPNKEMQHIGYDYLIDENNIKITKIMDKEKYDYKSLPSFYKEEEK